MKSPSSPSLRDFVAMRERDHRRIAYDLHDGPAQALARALLQVGIVKTLAESEEISRELDEVRELIKGALEEIHCMMRQLRPSSLESEGVVAKIEGMLKDLRKDPSMPEITFSVNQEEPPLSDSAQITLFRIVQEAVSNSVRHADASLIRVDLEFSENKVICCVKDDGQGFPVSHPDEWEPGGERLGLAGMRERVALLDGRIKIANGRESGSEVVVEIPVWEQA